MDMVVVVVFAPRSTLHFTEIVGWVWLTMKTKKRGCLFLPKSKLLYVPGVATLVLCFLTMTFRYTDKDVWGFSRVLGWSLCKDIPSLFNDTTHTIWNPQFEIVYGPDRKHTISTCFSEAKKQKSRPSLWTCPSLFSGIKRDNNENRSKPKSRPTYSFDNRNSVNRPKHEILLLKGCEM
jgi:hypothetical protein